jgi:DNA-binding transcriptional MerR regulator
MSIRTASPTGSRWLGPGALARQAGTSIKALRIYEKVGLLTPDRREGGWRLYGPAHIARLHQILALKALGLSLKQIGEALDRDGFAIGQIMDLQARHLASIIRVTRDRLQRVQQARDRIAQGGAISDDLLLELARDLVPPITTELKDVRAAITAAVLSEEDETAVRAITGQPNADERMEAEIGALLNEAAIAAAEGGDGSDRSLALADRWIALAATVEVPAVGTAEAATLGRMAARMATDPALADALTFIRAAIERRSASKQKG